MAHAITPSFSSVHVPAAWASATKLAAPNLRSSESIMGKEQCRDPFQLWPQTTPCNCSGCFAKKRPSSHPMEVPGRLLEIGTAWSRPACCDAPSSALARPRLVRVRILFCLRMLGLQML